MQALKEAINSPSTDDVTHEGLVGMIFSGDGSAILARSARTFADSLQFSVK